MANSLLFSFSAEIFLSFCLLASLLYNSFLASSSSLNYPLIDKQTFFQSLFILFCCIVIVFFSNFFSYSNGYLFVYDYPSKIGKIFGLVSTSVALCLGRSYLEQERIVYCEYYSVLLLSLLSFLLLTSCYDLITLFICLEMFSLCLYVLASSNKNSIYSSEAGLKYLILGSIISGFILAGCVLLYGSTGTTNFNNFFLLFSFDFYDDYLNFYGGNDPIGYSFSLGLIFLAIGLFFKLGAAPLHVWLPDVYEGSPVSSTLFFILVPQLAYLIILVRLFFGCFSILFYTVKPLFLAFGLISVIVGSLGAFNQSRLKRLLAFSSISHSGFLLLAMSSGSFLGVVSCFNYGFLYVITNALVWGCLLMSLRVSESSLLTSHLASLSYKTGNFAPFVGLVIGVFSLAGIPPFVGFFMKYLVFVSSYLTGSYEAATLILLVSSLGAFYYIRFLKMIAYENTKSLDAITDLSPSSNLSCFSKELSANFVSFCLLVSVFWLVKPSLLLLFSYKVGACLVIS